MDYFRIADKPGLIGLVNRSAFPRTDGLWLHQETGAGTILDFFVRYEQMEI